MNKVILIGNLTRDPELTQTQSGISMCCFSLAVNRRYTNADGEREADFINIVTWRSLADNCGKYLVKGNKVGVCGSLQTRNYTDKDGNKRYVTEVVADEVEFINTNGNEAREPQTAAKTGKHLDVKDLKPVKDDGLPF